MEFPFLIYAFIFSQISSDIFEKIYLESEKNIIQSKSLNFKNNSKNNYLGKNFKQKNYFPVYSKSSKMINNNRDGRHSRLERKLNK